MAGALKAGADIERTLAEIAAKLGRVGTLKVGFFEDATYPNGVSVPMVAAIQEFGAPSVGIPPRPFFRNAIAKHSKEWAQRFVDVLLDDPNTDTATALGRVGESIADDIRQSIVDTSEPPLSPVTIMLRGMRYNNPSLVVTRSTVEVARARVQQGKTNYGAPVKPLVDTGVLLNSVRSEVET